VARGPVHDVGNAFVVFPISRRRTNNKTNEQQEERTTDLYRQQGDTRRIIGREGLETPSYRIDLGYRVWSMESIVVFACLRARLRKGAVRNLFIEQ